MRALDRSKVKHPSSLADPSESVATEADQALAYYAAHTPWDGSSKAYSFKAYRDHDVRDALRQLANGKCAYCESIIGSVGARDVEHYRPKGGVTGAPKHPGYWWLAHQWDNLLPTCRACNRSLRQHIVTPDMTAVEVEELMATRPPTSFGKANQFEVTGARASDAAANLDAEDPLLIDPCRRDPDPELSWEWKGELSLLSPAAYPDGSPSSRGQFTIHACALNRAELVLVRTAQLALLRVLRQQILDDLARWKGDEAQLESLVERAAALREFHDKKQPFSGMAKAFVDDLLSYLRDWALQKGLPEPVL